MSSSALPCVLIQRPYMGDTGVPMGDDGEEATVSHRQEEEVSLCILSTDSGGIYVCATAKQHPTHTALCFPHRCPDGDLIPKLNITVEMQFTRLMLRESIVLKHLCALSIDN